MRLPEVRVGDLTALADQELLRSFDELGRCSKVAMRRVLSLLPEIVRRGLYRKAGFMSPYEFASKKAGASREVVDKVLRLHATLGGLDDLWGLLARGDEGWSKLDAIRTIANRDNAAHLATLVRRCSKAELEEYVRRIRGRQSGSLGASARVTADLAADEPQADPARQAAPAQDITEDAKPSVAAAQTSGAIPGRDSASGVPARPGACQPGASASRPQRGAASETARIEFDGRDPLETVREAESAVPPPAGPSAASNLMRFGDLAEAPATSLKAVTLYLTPEDDALLRALQGRYRLEQGKAIALGEVVGLLLRNDWPIGPAAESDRAGRTSATEARIPECPPDPPLSSSPGENRHDAGSGDLQGAREVSARLAHDRTVEIIVRVAELGANWLGRLRGVLPQGLAETFRSPDAVVLGDLYVQAVQAADRCRSDRIPAAVRRYVALRAGFHCEVAGCDVPINDLHHRQAVSDGGNHHPDNITAACKLHHKTDHQQLFADLTSAVPAQPDDAARAGLADRAFQAIRARIAASR